MRQVAWMWDEGGTGGAAVMVGAAVTVRVAVTGAVEATVGARAAVLVGVWGGGCTLLVHTG